MAGLLRTISRPLWRQQGATRARHGVPGLSIRTSPRVRPFSSASEDLEKAKARLSILTEDPGNDVKLKLYGLYKQVRRASLGSGWLSIANTPIPLVSSLPAFLLLRPPRRPPLVGALPSSLECSTWLGEQSGMLGAALGICHRFMNHEWMHEWMHMVCHRFMSVSVCVPQSAQTASLVYWEGVETQSLSPVV